MPVNRLECLIIRFSLIFVLLTVLSISQSAAQSFNVVDVKVEGNRTASSTLILSVAGIKPGDQLTASTTQDAVKRLYRLGFFKDIQIDAEEVTGGISLLVKVIELPKLSDIEFSGNKALKSKNLKEKISPGDGGYASPNRIFEMRNKIIDLYGEKGYFLVRIDYELKYSIDSSTVILTYKINDGSKIKVEKVILTGSDQVPADKIIGKMRNRKRGFLRSSNFDKEKYPEDKVKIIEYLHNKGYTDAYLKSDSIAIDSARNRMTIYLNIFEGPKYYFGKTEWAGNEVFSDKTLNKVLKYKEGQVFNYEKFDESNYEIYFLYQEKGYLHVRVGDERKTRDTLINITFDIVEGLPSEVNLVKIIGNTKTKEKVIRREMTIRPGQIFHRSLLIRSVRNIMQLNYFGNVTPDIVDLPSGDIDLIIEVEEKPTGQISAGAGYSGQDKFVGTFGLGIPNFRGMGQNLSFNIDIGSRRNSYSISFTEPWAFNTPTLAGADLYYTNRRWYEDYTEGRRGGSIRFGRRLKWPDDYFRIYTRYRLEDDRFYDFSDEYKATHLQFSGNMLMFDSTITIEPDTGAAYDTTVHFLTYESIDTSDVNSLTRFKEEWKCASSLQLTLARDSRNLPEFATKGSIISYSVEYTGGLLGGFWEYQKHDLSISKFIPIYKDIALAGKLTFGAIRAPSDNRILEFDRYSPGGTGYDGIVRGYDDGSLTPDSIAVTSRYDIYISDSIDVRPVADGSPDSTTELSYTSRVRGKYMIVGNLELQIPIVKNQFYGLLFLDAGRSWLHRNDIRLRDLYRGYGFGFRIIVPGIGTIGFDFGYPLDDRRNQDKKWHPHFQMGTTFR